MSSAAGGQAYEMVPDQDSLRLSTLSEDGSDLSQLSPGRERPSTDPSEPTPSEPQTWTPFVRPLRGHSDRVKACCAFEVTVAQYATLCEEDVWPEPDSPEEEAVKWLVERKAWSMDRIRRLFEKHTSLDPAESPRPSREMFSAKHFEGAHEELDSFVTDDEKALSQQSAKAAADRLRQLHAPPASAPTADTERTDIPSRSLVLSCSDDDTLKLWDMETGRCMRTFYGHTQIVRGCSVIDKQPEDRPEDRPLVCLSCSADCSLKIWELATGQCLRTLGNPAKRDLVAIKKRADRLHDARKSLEEARNSGSLLATTPRRSASLVLSSSNGSSRTTSPDSKSTYAYRRSEIYQRFENTPQAKLQRAASKIIAASALRKQGHADWVTSCAFFECNSQPRVLSTSSDGTMKVWDFTVSENASVEPLYTFGGNEHGHGRKPKWVMGCYVFNRDGCAFAVSSSQDYTLRVWRLDSEEEGVNLRPEYIFVGHDDWVGGCCAYLDETTRGDKRWKVLSCSDDQTLKVWDASEKIGDAAVSRTACHKPIKIEGDKVGRRSCIGTLRGHTNVVISCCTFKHKDKMYGLSSAGDNTLRLWDLRTFRCVRTLSCTDGTRGCWVHSNRGIMTAISCCGREFAADSHTVRLWDLRQVLEHSQENAKRNVGAADVQTVAGPAESIIICGHGQAGGDLRGSFKVLRTRNKGRVQMVDRNSGMELGYGTVELTLEDGYQGGKIAQLESNFANGCLAVALTPILDGRSAVDQGDELMSIDVSKVYASESLTSLIRTFTPIGREWLNDVEQDGRVSSTSAEADLTQLSVAENALRWAERITASRTGSLQVPEDLDSRQKEFLSNLEDTPLWEGVASGNKHKWRAKNIQGALCHFTGLIRSCEYKGEVVHARVLAWACVALVLSVSNDETDELNQQPPREKWREKQLLNPQDRWIAAEMIRPDRGERSASHNPLSFDSKNLVKHFLDAFIVLQTDAECCRIELDELLDSSFAANLFTDYSALLASFVEHLPLRPQRNKEYIKVGGSRKRIVVVGQRTVEYSDRPEDTSGSCCLYWPILGGCLCFYDGVFVGSSSVVVSPEGRTAAENTRYCGQQCRAWRQEQTVARYLVPLLGTGKYRPEDIDLLKRIVLETDASEPNMFRGEAIDAIVQYQWQTWVRRAYYSHMLGYLLFTAVFVSLSMVKDNCICEMRRYGEREFCYDRHYAYNADPDPDLDQDVAAPSSHVQWHSSQVWKRLLNVTMITTSLALVLLDQDNSKFHDLDAAQGMTVLTCTALIVSMIRGQMRFAFLINMLEHIIKDMMSFLAVSVLAIAAFTIAFCLLLRDTDAEYEWDRPHQYQTLLESMIGVVRLTLGDFGAASFNLSTTRPILTYSALLLFIFFVPIVLLNALIAIMNDTYEQVKVQKDERLLLERARITLDMDAMWHSAPGHVLCCRCASRCRRHATATDHEPRYLHVFKRETSDGSVDKVARHQEREDQGRAASAMEFQRQHSTLLAKVNAVAAFKSAGERGHSTPQSSPRQAQALGEIKAQLDHLKGLIAGLGLQHGPAIHE